VVGVLVSEFGYAHAFSTFSAIGILVAMLSPLYPRYIDPEPEEEEEVEDQTGLQAAYNYQLLNEEGEPLAPDADEAENP